MDKNAAETLRQICDQLIGCDEAWDGISYSAFYQDDDRTRAAVAAHISSLEETIAHLKAVQTALTPVDHAALKRILKRVKDE